MRKNILRSLAAVVILSLSISAGSAMSVFAFNRYAIDVDALKELTKTDTFEVRVTKKTVTDGVTSGFNQPNDMLTLTIENTSGKTVERVKVMIVCYSAENTAAPLASSGLPSISSGSEKRQFRLEEFAPENGAGGMFQLNVSCTHSGFTGASALVASYTCEGEEIVNPLAEEWNELALGSPTHILD